MLMPMEGPGDEELMRSVAAGDDHAFTLLVRRYQDLIYGTAYKMLGSHHADAEDIAQQVFIRAYKAAARWRPEAKLSTWLLTICRNCVFNHLQSTRHRPTIPLELPADTDQPVESLHPDPEARSADRLLLEEEMRRELEAAIAELPAAQRAALILRQYDQLDYEEIARVLDTTVPSVKSLLFRARETLRQRLHQYLHAT